MIRLFLKKYGWIYLPGILFLAINSRIQTVAPGELGKAIDLLDGPLPEKLVLYRQAGIIVLVAIGIFVTRFIWRMMIVLNARRMEVFLREELFKKLQRLPVSFFSKGRSGDLMAYAINDVGAVRMTFGPVLAMSLNGLITGSLSIFSMAEGVDPRLTALSLLPIPVAVIAIFVAGKAVNRKSRRVQTLFSELSGFVNEAILGIRIIKTFAREEEWLGTFSTGSSTMRDANIDLTDSSALISPITGIAFGISYAISLIYGGALVSEGALRLGDLVAFQGYLLLIQMPVVQLGRIVNMLQRGLASYARLSSIYNEPEIPTGERLPHPNPLSASIRVQDLTFTYPGMNRPALSGIHFELKAGEMLGIAGATGSGKTTLISLLLKFYRAPRGTVFIGEEDLADISALSVRDVAGYVPQDGFLFSSSVQENISFYKPGADLAQVRTAAALADIDREVLQFPAGYETMVGERGTHLSGGQKQRIALARALIRNPNILILDDTLSAVDTLTEQKIVANLEGVLKDKTSILISHRLSALQNASLILWMDSGRITERGTHDELMALGGAYAETYLKQSREVRRDD